MSYYPFDPYQPTLQQYQQLPYIYVPPKEQVRLQLIQTFKDELSNHQCNLEFIDALVNFVMTGEKRDI